MDINVPKNHISTVGVACSCSHVNVYARRSNNIMKTGLYVLNNGFNRHF